MSQHDFNIANQGFPATRADINNAFQAIASNSSGPTAPSTTYANQWWYDTTNDKMYLRNAADSAWIEVAVIDQTNNEWKITSGVIQAVDGDGIVLKTDDGNTRFTLDDTGNVTFAEGTDIITGSAGTDNVRIGAGAGDSIASGGDNNVLVGTNAGTALTTGDASVALGTDALAATTTASNNTAVGYRAGYSNTADKNTFVGKEAGTATTSGRLNTMLGQRAGASNTTASSNTFVGQASGEDNTTGQYNTSVGDQSLNSNTTASKNTAVGYQSMYSNTTASENTAMGYQALYNNTTGYENAAFGESAALNNTTGYRNTALGRVALLYNTTGYQNTAVGKDALRFNTTGYSNTAIGHEAGYYISTGSKNTILGRYNGNQGGLDIRTSNNNIVLSDGDGNPQFHIKNTGRTMFTQAVGGYGTLGSTLTGAFFDPESSGRDTLYLGSSSSSTMPLVYFYNSNAVVGRIETSGSSTSYVTSSDYRLKENVVDMSNATDRLKQLQPKRFNFIADTDTTVDGFLAHEVQSVVPEAISGEKDATKLDEDGNTVPVYQGIDQSKLVPLLVATIKELEARITALEAN